MRNPKIHICECAHTRRHTLTHVRTCVCTHTHMHTHIQEAKEDRKYELEDSERRMFHTNEAE